MSDSPRLDEFFAERPGENSLGMVVGGSLSEGLLVRLDPRLSIERLAVGRYVVVEGKSGRRFFGLVTDIVLASTNPDLANQPPDPADGFTTEVYGRAVAYGTLHVSPMLMLDPGDNTPRPIKTIPSHFSRVAEATAEDVARVFGAEDEKHLFLGTPLDMENVQVNLDLSRFVERSSGVFGKSGTGKSFITRILLAGIVRSRQASALIFDMHNDYGWAVKDEAGREFKGLRQLFTGGQVVTITLDPKTSRARGSKIDGEFAIAYDRIEPEDVEMLTGLMGLSDVQRNALYVLRRKLGAGWVARLLQEEDDRGELQALVDSGRIMEGTLDAIQRRFQAFFPRMGFVTDRAEHDVVERIFQYLNQKASVVLEFGNYGNELAAYIFVANYLTRRIRQRYIDLKNLAAGKQAEEPHPLVIVIEEAHKFLDPEFSSHTVFGAIARELRKYNVTLLVVDQRPSAIDDEVMSQIGTRVTCLLDNEADIRAVFSGVSGGGALREVLARLDTRQQALVLGHAVPMPVVVRTRDYDQDFYLAMGLADGEQQKQRARRGSEALFGS
jgi:DNA helicase HerA-like ATPase